MCATRVARKDRARANRRRLLLVVAGTIVLVAGAAVAIAATGRLGWGRKPARPAVAAVEAPVTATVEATVSAKSTPEVIEVPDVRGRALAEAEMVMSLAGFDVERKVDTTAAPDPDRKVTGQLPVPGIKLEAGATVVLVHAREPKKSPARPTTQFVVVLDPGHQRHADMGTESIGPGSSERKTKVTGGTRGVATHKPEYELTLELSKRIRKRLQAKGVKVVMTRIKHDVDLTNIERAKKGNQAGADLVVLVHADGNVDRAMRGVSTLIPVPSGWTKPIAERSERAGRAVQAEMVRATGAKDLGLHERGDITGFNWSKVPVILVETGFMSNPSEDRLLASGAYQDKLADGIVGGVMEYLSD